MQTLKVQRNRIAQANYRLKERDKILFQTCISALNEKNKEKAAICANEIAEVRKLAKFFRNIELAIERVLLRLETIKELNDIIFDLKPALKLLQGVSQQLFEILPDVSSELSKVNDEIVQTLNSTKITADESLIPVGAKTPAGDEILKEVSSFLERKISDELPEPPIILEEAPKLDKNSLKEMVALAASCSQAVGSETVEESSGESSQTLFSFKKAEIQEISLKVEKEKSSLEDVLLEYVKRSNGEIDLTRCSVDLKTSYEEIEQALENLGAKGKIRIELRTEG